MDNHRLTPDNEPDWYVLLILAVTAVVAFFMSI